MPDFTLNENPTHSAFNFKIHSALLNELLPYSSNLTSWIAFIGVRLLNYKTRKATSREKEFLSRSGWNKRNFWGKMKGYHEKCILWRTPDFPSFPCFLWNGNPQTDHKRDSKTSIQERSIPMESFGRLFSTLLSNVWDHVKVPKNFSTFTSPVSKTFSTWQDMKKDSGTMAMHIKCDIRLMGKKRTLGNLKMWVGLISCP